MRIKRIAAREVLDSRGKPTLEAEVFLENGRWGRAMVPSGASTGLHEALELRDRDPSRFSGNGVLKAIQNIRTQIAPALEGMSAQHQAEIDQKLRELDGTPNKSRLGANAMLGVSLAVCRAAAQAKGLALYRHIREISPFSSSCAFQLPLPLLNILNGGRHADNRLDIQEFMIVPVEFQSFREALRAGCEIYQALKSLLQEKGLSTAIGDEGGFAPHLSGHAQALDLLLEAIRQAGYLPGSQIKLAVDAAASEFFRKGQYLFEGKERTASEMIATYRQWAQRYPLFALEDGLAQDDWEGWTQLTRDLGSSPHLVGDDLFVTDPQRLRLGIQKKAANAILIKPNQIGTLTETLQTIQMAQENNYFQILSHRSGETEDSLISDLAVASRCGAIKTGAPCRSERTAKYNQLLRIEEGLSFNHD
ncbi:MAG: phosphopyruvate hydratase [Elusimicrobia bacterium]|nr:phosphopyruvate hydratase [Elusimicrobiota bacterium]